jgi:indolepyruvate decarboxylase
VWAEIIERNMKQTIGTFLIRRLHEAGVEQIFGVPGDYNLELMQQLEDRGEPASIGNCNERNAGCAAAGYARINGLGAMTNGVGALSARNGIAAAYCEHVPDICIRGSIPAKSVQRGDLMHHTLADRENGAFAAVTVAQAVLSPENAVTEVDRLILTSWRRKLPVYIELPSDISYLEIEVPSKPLRLAMSASDSSNLRACAQAILERPKAAKSRLFCSIWTQIGSKWPSNTGCAAHSRRAVRKSKSQPEMTRGSAPRRASAEASCFTQRRQSSEVLSLPFSLSLID